MRIGLLVYDGLDNTTGGFLYDRKVVEYLRDQGHTVEVIAIPWEDYRTHLRDNLGAALSERLGSLSVDVLLEDELCHPSLIGPNRRLDGRVPIVSIVHHLRSSEPGSKWRKVVHELVERLYLNTVDGFIYNSETTRQTVETRIGQTNGIVAPPAGDRLDVQLDPPAVRDRAHETGPLRLVFVGTITPRKGLDTLVRGLARLPDGTWTLEVIGDRSADRAYVDRITRLIETQSLGSVVTLHGRLSDEAVATVLADSHLLAVPSTYEGYGIVYLEGMAFGLPALATTAGGTSEIVTDGETGMLVPPADPDAIATAIRPLIDDRDRLADMSVAALERYRAHHSWADTGARIETFLRSMA
ncbi:MAG: glycosyltransferase family 4 protein [Halobacteriales archaeon]